MSTTCRNHTYDVSLYSCPCFWDNCNYYVEVTKDTKGNTVGQQDLKPPIKDSPGYSANNPAKKTPVIPSAGGGGGGDDTTTAAGAIAADLTASSNLTDSACRLRTTASRFWTLLSLIYILCQSGDMIGL
ncbi:hypothetical protein RvY_18598 [Ramazzottius varieornatus]|uniref:Uncharacterized protein n=1 Tax=Ramazzottius varieornatus TaxID=947166 RepID=A0A1D1W6N5_RAMVA|nr:hypothetical protein RvY_18598 [Ramazzottius varieornatus]